MNHLTERIRYAITRTGLDVLMRFRHGWEKHIRMYLLNNGSHIYRAYFINKVTFCWKSINFSYVWRLLAHPVVYLSFDIQMTVMQNVFFLTYTLHSCQN